MLKPIFLKNSLLIVCSVLSWANSGFAEEIYDARTLKSTSSQRLSMDQMVSKIPKGSIVLIAEKHNVTSMQQGELDLLKALRNQGHKVNLGMELLQFSDQSNVDAYRKGTMTEEAFKASSWGESDFNFYRDQILFPKDEDGEKTFAVNSPKALPIAVKTKGIAHLSAQEKAMLPPHFRLGRASYRERFREKMSYHVAGKKAMKRYFETQSVWDDTMAWKVCEAKSKSEGTLVLIVGQFHVEYGDGLIHRIRARCGKTQPIVSVYQYLFYNDETYDVGQFAPSPKYGPIADYLVIVKED